MNKKKLITFSPKHIERMEFIKEIEGQLSLSAVIHTALIYYYDKKYFDKRASGTQQRLTEEPMTEAEICTEKHGGTVEERNGTEVCIIGAGSAGQLKRTVPLGIIRTWVA